MARQLWQPDDAELERELIELRSHLAYPETPELARSVRSRLVAGPGRPRPFWEGLRPLHRNLAFAAVALLVLFGSVLLIPDARTAVAHFLGLRGVIVTTVPSPLPSMASPSPSISPGSLGTSLKLGQGVTMADAQNRVRFHILVPSLVELGDPDEVYFTEPPAGGEVALVYWARPGLPQSAQTGVGLLIMEFRGDLEPGLFQKVLGPESRLTEVRVNGVPGYWIEGKPHLFYYRDANGLFREETLRLAGNTLLWEQGNVTLRIESALTKDQVLRIAQSMR